MKKHARWTALTITLSSVCLLAACGGGGGTTTGNDAGSPPSAATLSADVYPLSTGDRRAWRTTTDAGAPVLKSERVAEPAVVGGLSALAVRTDNKSVDFQVRTGTSVLSVPGPGADVLTTAAGPVELLRFGIGVGERVVSLDRTVSVDVNGDGRADSVTLQGEFTFIGTETITTAAGTFTGAAHVQTQLRSTFTAAGQAGSGSAKLVTDEWYAPGVGLVRSTSTITINNGAPSTEAKELIAYSVGGRRSESSPPLLVSGSPSTNGSLTPTAGVTLDFTEPMEPFALDVAGAIDLFDASGRTVAVTRSLSSDWRRLTLQPQTPLPDGSYELRTGNALTDLAGNAFASTTRVFVVDTAGPRIVVSTPAQNSETFPLTGILKVTFNEPVFAAAANSPAQSADLNFEILDEFGSRVQTLPASLQGADVTGSVVSPLQPNTAYLVALTGTLVDSAGNPAVASNYIRFRTDPGPLARPQPLMSNAVVHAVTQGDINADGLVDVVVVAQTLGTSNFFVGARLKQADGSFAAMKNLFDLPQGRFCNIRSLVVADVDADGLADVALTGCGNGIDVLRQQSRSVFALETIATNVNGDRIAAFDLDGDGRTALVTALFGVGKLHFLRRGANGTWASALEVDSGSDFVGHVRTADLNGDGRLDLIWLRPRTDNHGWELAWSIRRGAGFEAARSVAIPDLLTGPNALAVGDVSGDGRPDVVLLYGGNANSNIVVLRQDTVGGFEAPLIFNAGSNASAFALGDMNGDGRLDIVVGHSARHALGVLLQAGDGTYQPERQYESGYGYYDSVDAMQLLDINGDGRLDIVLLNDVMEGRPVVGPWPPGAARYLAQLGGRSRTSGAAKLRQVLAPALR